MKSKDQLLLEQAYASIALNLNKQQLNQLVEMDRLAIEQLIEENFGDLLKKAGGAIKGGISKVKEKMTAGIANLVAKLIIGKLGDKVGDFFLTLKDFADGKGKVTPEMQAAAKQISSQPAQVSGAPASALGAQTVTKESFQQNKRFLASFLFTEENVSYILESLYDEGLLLTEGRGSRVKEKVAKRVELPVGKTVYLGKTATATGAPAGKTATATGAPAGKDAPRNRPAELSKLTKEIVNKVQAIYQGYRKDRTEDQVRNWLDKTGPGSLRDALGVKGAPAAAAAVTSSPKEDAVSSAEKTGTDTASAGTASAGRDATFDRGSGGASAGGETGGSATGGTGTGTGTDSGPGVIAPPSSGGLIAKIKNFVTKNPKISATIGVAIAGLVAAAFAGSAPVLGPALWAAGKGAALAGGGNVISQLIGKKKGENVNWKSVAGSAAAGAALAGVGSILSAGLGNISSMLTGGFGGSKVASTRTDNFVENPTRDSGTSETGSTTDNFVENPDDSANSDEYGATGGKEAPLRKASSIPTDLQNAADYGATGDDMENSKEYGATEGPRTVRPYEEPAATSAGVSSSGEPKSASYLQWAKQNLSDQKYSEVLKDVSSLPPGERMQYLKDLIDSEKLSKRNNPWIRLGQAGKNWNPK